RVATGIPTERLADGFNVGAVLKRERRSDRGVPRVHVGRAVRLVIAQEEFADPSIRKSADRYRVSQPGNLELERFGYAPIGQATARGHDAASRPTTAMAS